jgi:predicted TIM-barrel fold metal-dependent hydrolase
MPGIIDVHAHLSENNQDELIPYAALNGLKYNLEELLQKMAENGVSRGLLLSPPIRGGLPLPNERIVELCRRSGGVLSPVFTVEPSTEEVQRAVGLAQQTKELKGFKIRLGYLKVFADDPVYDPLYGFAEAEDLPVMFHTGDTATSNGSLEHSHPLTLDRLANTHPGLKIVVCHFGNPWSQDVAELIYKHPNVFADISGLIVGGTRYQEKYLDSLAEQISRAVYYAGGAEKVMFGTDYPVSTYTLSLELVRRLKVDQADRDAILMRNALRVFRL